MIRYPGDEKFEKEIGRWEKPSQAVLPLFHKCMEQKNYISDDDIQRVGRVSGLMPTEDYLAVSEVVSIGTFYQHFVFHPTGKHVVRVCMATACLVNGSARLLMSIARHLGIGLEETTSDGLFSLHQDQCIGHCADAPCFMIDGDSYKSPLPGEIPFLLDDYAKRPECQPLPPPERLLQNEPVVFAGLASPTTAFMKEYRDRGGYRSLERTVLSLSPEDILAEIEKSGLSGRGGGGFPAFKKFASVRLQPPPRYIICNADEGEPGTFKDRAIMERDPHLLIEGMLITAYAMGARSGYIYIRSEYPHAYRILDKAISEAVEKGYIGDRVLGTDFSFNLRLYRGAGAYICGEETALIESLEGKRGFPRNKPPHVFEKGLWQCSTDVSNVETLANLPAILEKGGNWYGGLGDGKTPGTKLFCLSGNISCPGLFEIPFGKTLRDLIFGLGGGIPGNRQLKAVLPSGHVSQFLLPHQIDISLDDPSFKDVGAMLGSGSVIVLDDSNCMVNLAFWVSVFFHHESCGQCTPCRDGTEDVYEIMVKIVQGEGKKDYLDYLQILGGYMVEASICGLGVTAPTIPLSSIIHFREEWEEHILGRRCALGVCPMERKMMLAFPPRRSRGFFDDIPGLLPAEP